MEPIHSEKQPVQEEPTSPVMDIVAPKPAETTLESNPKNEESTKDAKHQAVVKAVKPMKQPSNGVGLAILATIIIVLGLAILMVYAYLRTNHINNL